MNILEWLESAQGVAAAIGALVVGIAAVARKAIAKWREVLRLVRREKRVTESHKRWHRAYQALGDFVELSGCSRALLLTAQNCGWTDPSRQLSISVIAERTAHDSVPQVFERFQGWTADTSYRAMIAELWETREDDRGLLLVANEMQPGVLKDYYTESGVSASVVFFVGLTESDALLYVSLNFGCLHDEQGDEVAACDLQAEEEKAREFYKFAERVRRKAWHMRAIWKDAK